MNISTKKKRLTTAENTLAAAKGRGGGGGKIGSLWLEGSTSIYRMDIQQGPTVQHRELYTTSCEKS